MGFLIGSEQIWQLPWWMSACVTRVSQWSGSKQICNCDKEDFMSLRMEGTDCRPCLVAQDNDSLQDFLGLSLLLTVASSISSSLCGILVCFMVFTLSIHIILRQHYWSPWSCMLSPGNEVSLSGAWSKHSDVRTLWAIPRADSVLRVLVILHVYCSLGLVVAGKAWESKSADFVSQLLGLIIWVTLHESAFGPHWP